MFAIYNNVARGSLTIFFFFFKFSYYLFKPSNYIITVIITVMFINITVMGVLEKLSGGVFQVKNSSGMVCPYSSC